MDTTNGGPRSIPFGIRVKLNANNVVTESQGRHGMTLDPREWGDEWVIRSLEANPSFNLVLLDGDRKPIFMLDRSLDLVEMLPRCFDCSKEGGYLVVVGAPGFVRTYCLDCHEKNRAKAPRWSGGGPCEICGEVALLCCGNPGGGSCVNCCDALHVLIRAGVGGYERADCDQ